MIPMAGMSAAEAPRRAHLYVGNLSPRVTEYMLTEIFAVAGPVQHVKIIFDQNYQHGGSNYGFVEYVDMRAAETALQTLNGRKIFDIEIRVNWAYQGQQNKEDTTNHYHVFVGDLSPEVNDDVLLKAFSAFGSLSDARVMWDMNSGKSRGYGFLAFRDKADAEQAIATMNGEWLGSRAIRVNWANSKTQQPGSGPVAPARRVGGGGPYVSGGTSSIESVIAQAALTNCTVYVGNLAPTTTQADLIPLFQTIGYVVEIRMQADRGFAFVKVDSHEHAASAIVQLQGVMVHNRPLKCSWGREKAVDGQTNVVMQPAVEFPFPGFPGFSQAGYAPPGFPQTGYPGSPQTGYPGSPQTGYPVSPPPGGPPGFSPEQNYHPDVYAYYAQSGMPSSGMSSGPVSSDGGNGY